MALRGSDIGLVMVLMTALWAGASAQLACTTAIIGMSPCLGYITGNSSAPSSTCCSQLSSVVSNQPQCLCMVLNGGASSFGINLNRTQALALPGACNVQTPPVSRCNAASPAAAPTGTPVSTTPSKPTVPTASSPTAPSTPSVSTTTPSKPSATPTVTAGSGSKTAGSASSAASSTAKPLSFALVLSVLFVGPMLHQLLLGSDV